MKSLLLLLLAGLLSASSVAATGHDPKPKQLRAVKRAFKKQGTAKNRANKAQFKQYGHPVTVDLHPKDPRRFTKVKAGKPYTYPQPHR